MSLFKIALAAALVIIGLNDARAETVSASSPEALRGIIQVMQADVLNLQTKFRDVRCPQQPTKVQGACVAAYNALIAMVDARRARAEAILAAVLLPEPARSKALKVVQDPARFNRDNNEARAFGDQIDLLFPVPRQPSEK